MPILQINFKLNVPAAAYVSHCQTVVNAFTNLPGLLWKIWILNEEAGEAGGIYCFDNEDSLNAYLEGPIVAGLKQLPAVANVSAKRFDVVQDLTRITRGPIGAALATP